MQLYVVTWKFESSEYQTFAGDALIEYVESGKADEHFDCKLGSSSCKIL